jgi:hypothetical protein
MDLECRVVAPMKRPSCRPPEDGEGGQRVRTAMGRALLVIAIVATTLNCAAAQFGGAPGLPGGPPGAGFGGSPQGPPPKCRALLAIRDELQKHGQAISTANEKNADVKVACGLFRKYIATEAKMIKMLEVDGPGCGAPAQVLQQVRDSHAKAQQIGQQVCDAARRPFRPPPVMDDMLIPPAPMPRREPWPTRLSERQ